MNADDFIEKFDSGYNFDIYEIRYIVWKVADIIGVLDCGKFHIYRVKIGFRKFRLTLEVCNVGSSNHVLLDRLIRIEDVTSSIHMCV